MKHSLFLILFSLFLGEIVDAQSPVDTAMIPVVDTLNQKDTVISKDSTPPIYAIDSFSKRPVNDSGRIIPASISFSSTQFSWEILKYHPYFSFNTKPTDLPKSALRKINGKELMFYLLVFLLIVFALLRRAFPKYFGDLFRLFFRTTLKQRQIQEQLTQTPLPSLLLNCFFVVSTGLYITFLLLHFKLNPGNNFWQLFLYCFFGLSVAYFVKFIGLKVSGWLFDVSDAADSYIFIVFIVNKIFGILLLPFLILLAFSEGNLYAVSLTLSWGLVACLLLYRFILTYAAIRNQVKVNPFHFFLYLIAFEIAPLLLVYKGLLLFFGITT